MKKVYIIFYILLSTTLLAKAQYTPDDFYNKMVSVFQNVDRSQISTGLLAEYGLDLINYRNFDGVALNDSNKISLNEWRNLYISLYSMRINENTSMSYIDVVNSNLNQYHSDTINLVGLNFDYNTIRTDAITSNLLRVTNDQLFDVAGRTQSPYLKKTAFSIVAQKQVFNTMSSKFILRPELFFTNSTKTISTIQCDQGNGYFNIQWNVPFTLSDLQGYGNFKTIKFKLNFTDGSSLVSQTQLSFFSDVSTTQSTVTPQSFPYFTGSIPITSSKSYLGESGKGTIYVALSSKNLTGRIRKPLIVAEGFDAWKILTPGDPNTNYSYFDFINQLNSQYTYLNDQIENADEYDLIFLDYDNGTDHIQRNAYLLESVISYVNAQKQLNGSNEQNVVLGISMGGLVARYALRDMEKTGLTHQTRLFISMDSPHQGANVPLSLQTMLIQLTRITIKVGVPLGPQWKVYNVGDAYPELRRGYDLLFSPAARQMLKYQSNGESYPTGTGTAFQTFMTEYQQLGYPVQSRNVAISNGSECGKVQLPQPLTDIFSYQFNYNMSYFEQLGWSFSATIAGIFTNKPLQLIPQGVLAPLSTKTSLYVDFWAKTLPSQQSVKIYQGKAGIKRKILGIIPITTNFIDGFCNSSSTMLAIDSAPGGVANFTTFGFNANVPGFQDAFKQKSFGFVPTVSSLDIGGGAVSITPADLTAVYSTSTPPVAPKNTPFVNFVTAGGENQIHTEFNRNNGDWILAELRGQNPQYTCMQFCQGNVVINGVTNVCTNATFQLSQPGFDNTTWSISPAGLATLSQNGSSVTVTKTGNGVVKLIANISGRCGTNTITKDIAIGNPMPIASPLLEDPILGKFKVSIEPVVGATSYKWYENGTFKTQNSNTVYSGQTVRNFCGLYSIDVKAVSPCGESNMGGYLFNVPCEGTFVIANNPSDQSFEIVFNESQNTEALASSASLTTTTSESNYDVKLYDKKMLLVKSKQTPNKRIVINTANLPNDIYFLIIKDGSSTFSRQIMVQH